jgi:hypothetical protein
MVIHYYGAHACRDLSGLQVNIHLMISGLGLGVFRNGIHQRTVLLGRNILRKSLQARSLADAGVFTDMLG